MAICKKIFVQFLITSYMFVYHILAISYQTEKFWNVLAIHCPGATILRNSQLVEDLSCTITCVCISWIAVNG